MSSHKIFLSKTGYFIKSFEFFRDISYFILSFAMLIFCLAFNLHLLAMFLGVIVVFAIVFIIKIHRGEYVYFNHFFLQPVLFFLITPVAFIRIEIIACTVLVGGVILISKKSFRSLDFPFGLFLSIFSVSISFILMKLNLMSFFAESRKLNLMFMEPSPGISGLFFLPGFEIDFENVLNFSLLENYGMYLPILVPIFLLIRGKIVQDSLALILMLFTFLAYYLEDPHFFSGKIVVYTVIWYYLSICIGRNFQALYLESFLSGLTVFGVAVFLDPYKYPPILLIIVFFLIRSILAILREKRIFQEKGILKTGFK